MKSNKKARSKYTIGPYGEIYNNRPALSERSKQLLELLMIKDVLEDAFKGDDEDGNKGTTDDGDQSVCD